MSNRNQMPSAPPASMSGTSLPQPLDLIFIEGLSGETVIGIHESELHHPQPIVIDVHAGLLRARACEIGRAHV